MSSQKKRSFTKIIVSELEVPVTIVTATQEPIVIKGYAKLQISINGFVTQHKFLIADKIGEDVILGMDFLQQNSCVIDIAKQQLKCKTDKKQIVKLIPVNMAETIVLLNRTCSGVKRYINYYYYYYYYYYFHQNTLN